MWRGGIECKSYRIVAWWIVELLLLGPKKIGRDDVGKEERA